jgi:hypothetical protein
MENGITKDIGEEIIAKLKELNKILKEIAKKKHEEECTTPSPIRIISD